MDQKRDDGIPTPPPQTRVKGVGRHQQHKDPHAIESKDSNNAIVMVYCHDTYAISGASNTEDQVTSTYTLTKHMHSDTHRYRKWRNVRKILSVKHVSSNKESCTYHIHNGHSRILSKSLDGTPIYNNGAEG